MFDKKDPIISVDSLVFTYPGREEPSLRNVSLEVETGDFLAIVGNNGCGKSTLCKSLNGLIPHFIMGDIEGTVAVCGLDVAEQEIGVLAQKVGYVYQDFENQIVRPTALDDASFACLNFAMDDYEEKGLLSLQMVGLDEKKDDFVWQLSGGQKHLLALAGVLALSPEIIILDEPVAQLDPAHARQIYDTLRKLNTAYGKTIIVIEHHTEFIAEYCRNVILMNNGEIKWKLAANEALRRVDELEENRIFPPQVTVAAKKLRDRDVLDKHIPLPTTLRDGGAAFAALEADMSRLPNDETPPSNAPSVEYKSVTVEYRAVKGDNHRILNDFSLTFPKGGKIALIGGNGAGKSTLMKLLIGLVKPSGGEVLLDGKPTRSLSAEELSNTVSLVYQNPEEMFIQDSIRGDVEYAMKARGMADYAEKAENLLSLFDLGELGDRDGRMLSGGQMRRASLAIGIALNPSVLLLDEPTANLDIATRKEIMKTLTFLKDTVETVVIATHDMQLVCEWAEQIVVLSAGKLIAIGNRDEIFQNEAVVETAGIRPPEIYRMGKLLSPRANCYTVADFVACFSKGGLQNVC
jgi:energy-coupling factor transport system ATP-binding protein